MPLIYQPFAYQAWVITSLTSDAFTTRSQATFTGPSVTDQDSRRQMFISFVIATPRGPMNSQVYTEQISPQPFVGRRLQSMSATRGGPAENCTRSSIFVIVFVLIFSTLVSATRETSEPDLSIYNRNQVLHSYPSTYRTQHCSVLLGPDQLPRTVGTNNDRLR